MPQAVEEAVRWESPLLITSRITMADTTLGGVDIAAGTQVVPNVGAANHDETRWDNPDDFDIFRPVVPHISFGVGPHMCLGMHLARMETKVVMERLLDRIPNVRVDPDADEPYITGMTFRAPPKLEVVF
jgi:cytochrome P450